MIEHRRVGLRHASAGGAAVASLPLRGLAGLPADPSLVTRVEYRLRVGKRLTGFCVVQDVRWPNMYRVRWPGGELSDMVNLSRAKDAAVRFAYPRGLGDKVAHWDRMETRTEGALVRSSERAATSLAGNDNVSPPLEAA